MKNDFKEMKISDSNNMCKMYFFLYRLIFVKLDPLPYRDILCYISETP